MNRKDTSEFITKCLSSSGSFKKNRDFSGFITLDNFGCWVIVDGIDSSDEENSAQKVASSIIEDFTQKPGLSRKLVKKYIKNAHNSLLEFNGKSKLRASLTLVISDYNKLILGTVGNTRAYHYRKEKLIHKTKDHSISQLMSELGDISQDKANKNKYRNLLYSYLGCEEKFRMNVSPRIKLQDDDLLLMSTEGMWENVEEEHITNIVRASMDAEEIIENLEHSILENERGNLNNYTIMSLAIPKVFNKKEQKIKIQDEKPPKKINFDFLKNKHVKKILMITLLALVAGIGLYIKKNIDNKAKLLANKQQVEEIKIQKEEKANDILQAGDLKNALKEFEEAREKFKDDPEKIKEIDEKIVKIKAEISLQELEQQGDKNFESKDYEGALNKYSQALNIAKTHQVGNSVSLEDKVNHSKDIMKFMALEKSGDEALGKQKYEEAKGIFDNIISTADPNKFSEIIERSKQKNLSLEKIADAIIIERQGLDFYKRARYEQAKAKFNQAFGIYSEVGMEQKKREMKSHLAEIEELQLQEETLKEGKSLEEAGDKEIEKKNYNQAKAKYEESIKKYEFIGNSRNVAIVNNKILNIELLKKYDNAREIEKEGDVLYSNKRYKRAIEKFEEAKKIYGELNKPEDFAAMNEKIEISKKKDKFLGIF